MKLVNLLKERFESAYKNYWSSDAKGCKAYTEPPKTLSDPKRYNDWKDRLESLKYELLGLDKDAEQYKLYFLCNSTVIGGLKERSVPLENYLGLIQDNLENEEQTGMAYTYQENDLEILEYREGYVKIDFRYKDWYKVSWNGVWINKEELISIIKDVREELVE